MLRSCAPGALLAGRSRSHAQEARGVARHLRRLVLLLDMSARYLTVAQVRRMLHTGSARSIWAHAGGPVRVAACCALTHAASKLDCNALARRVAASSSCVMRP